METSFVIKPTSTWCTFDVQYGVNENQNVQFRW